MVLLSDTVGGGVLCGGSSGAANKLFLWIGSCRRRAAEEGV